MKDYRHLTASEIDTLKQNGCTHCDWSLVWVKENFKPDYIRDTVFSGEIKLGVLEKRFSPGWRGEKTRMHKPCGNPPLRNWR